MVAQKHTGAMWIIVCKHRYRSAMYTPHAFVCGPFDEELEARRMAMLLWGREYYYMFVFEVWDVQGCADATDAIVEDSELDTMD